MTEKANTDAQKIVVDAMDTIVNALNAAREKNSSFSGEWSDEEFQHSKFFRALDQMNDKFGFEAIARTLAQTELV